MDPIVQALDQGDRDLIVTAVQALYRERLTAWRSAETVAQLRGTAIPDRQLFGLQETVTMLRRLGASPSL